MLVRCLYASRAAAKTTRPVVAAILEQSRRNNPRRGITGLLCFNEATFVQILEGSREAVSDLFGRLVRDERHTDIRLLLFEEVAERRFGNWTMGEVAITKANQALVLKFSEMPSLDPFALPARATLALLEELVLSGAAGSRPT